MKVAFKSAILWCWIWASIHANHFYNLKLIEFKSYSAPTCIWITLSNLGWFFQKNINNLRSWTKLLRQNLARFNVDTGRWGGEFGICKIESFLEFTGFSTFLSTIFVQDCSFYSRIMFQLSIDKKKQPIAQHSPQCIHRTNGKNY